MPHSVLTLGAKELHEPLLWRREWHDSQSERIGSGVYRAGGAVTSPQLISQVRPTYTADALDQRIQGSVELELVVTTKPALHDYVQQTLRAKLSHRLRRLGS